VGEAKADIVELAKRGDAAALGAALEDGAEVDAADRWGVTALGYAAARGDLAAVRLLLDRGASVDKTSAVGNAPLMLAAARGHLEVVQALLDAGADPTAKNKWGFGAADWGNWPANAAEVLALLHAKAG